MRSLGHFSEAVGDCVPLPSMARVVFPDGKNPHCETRATCKDQDGDKLVYRDASVSGTGL